MKLFYANNTCAIGIRVILEEIGAKYQALPINFAAKEQFSPEFRAVNPKGKVPALVRDDGSVLTEYQAIAFWLARQNPRAGLVPTEPEAEIRLMEVLDYIVGSVHMRGFTFVLVPMKFTPSPAGQDDMRAYGLDQIKIGFGNLAETMGDKPWLLEHYSIADTALFYLTLWAVNKGIPMPDRIAAHYNRMLERPAVQRALAGEGMVAKTA